MVAVLAVAFASCGTPSNEAAVEQDTTTSESAVFDTTPTFVDTASAAVDSAETVETSDTISADTTK